MARPVMTLKVDLNDDGVFDSDWSAFLIDCSYQLGRRSALDRFGARTARFLLDNTDSRFSPRNTSSPYSPNVKRGKRIRLSQKVTTPAVTNLFRNPSAETNLTDYATEGSGATITRQTEDARQGKYCVRPQTGGNDLDYAAQLQTTVAPTATNHIFSVFVKGKSGSIGLTGKVRLRASGGAGGDEQGALVAFTFTAEWQLVSCVLNVTASDHTNMDGRIFRLDADDNILAGEQFLADAWMVEATAGSVPSLYCDGDQPSATWSGTVHASQSSRVVDPSENVFTGEIRDIKPARRSGKGVVTIEATGITEPLLRQIVSAGPFTRVRADRIAERLLDIAEIAFAESKTGITPGNVFLDSAVRHDAETWTALAPATITSKFDSGAAGDDPVVYDALEGDNMRKVVTGGGGGNSGIESEDLVSRVTTGKYYHFSIFVRPLGAVEAGEIIAFRLFYNFLPFSQVTKTLVQDEWVRLEFTHQIAAGATGISVQVFAFGGWNPGTFYVDCAHGAPAFQSGGEGILPFTFLGTKWAGDLEYVDAVQRPVGAVLDEVARSVGGWYYENGSGKLVLEDYSQRDDGVVSTPRVRFTDSGGEGLPYRMRSVEEPAENEAGKVKVGSFGDVMALPSILSDLSRMVWALEPAPRTFAANELQRYFADYASEGLIDDPGEGQSGLIARRAATLIIPLSNWATDSDFGLVQTPYVLNYGRGGEVVVKNNGTGKDALLLFVFARPQSRSTSERAFLTNGAGVPILELEMPAQGYKTQAMTDLLTWAAGRYTNSSPLSLELTFHAIDTELQLWAMENWIGVPAIVIHNSGPGAFSMDDTLLYYCESVDYRYNNKGFPIVTLGFEES